MTDRFDAGGESTAPPAADSDAARTDGGVLPYTVRLELVDEPGELLRALQPIAENGGNLLGIHHERGNITPRGRIPVEVDLECPPSLFDDVVDGLREAGINVIQAGADQYGEEVSIVLVGHLVDTDLSDTFSRIEGEPGVTIVDFSLAAPEGVEDVSSARVRLAFDSGRAEHALEVVRTIAMEKDFCVIEPLLGGEG